MADLQAEIPEFSLREAITVLFKRRLPILACYGGILAVTFLYCLLAPPTYEAGVRFLLKHDRQDPLITADQQSVQMLSRPAVTEEDLNSEMAVMQSQTVLEKTVRDLGLDTAPISWTARLAALPGAGLRGLYNLVHGERGPTRFDRAVAQLRKRLLVMPEKRSAILDARLRWGNPVVAARILERVSDHYMTQHVAVRGQPETQAFFLEQMEKKKADLAAIEQQIQGVRAGSNGQVIEYERQLAIQQSAEFEAEWRKA